MRVALSEIRLDGGTQSRAATDEATIEAYKEAMERGDKFPPVIVYDDGKDKWLADGFHRYISRQELGKKDIAVEIRKGTLQEAILFAVSANATHGKPRTSLDKRRCVEVILRRKEWRGRADTWVADTCRVSTTLVREMRKLHKLEAGDIRERRDGKKHNMADTRKRVIKAREKKAVKPIADAKAEEITTSIVADRLYEDALSFVRRLDLPRLARLREEIDEMLHMRVAAV